jgi:hypothetical protein
MTAWYLRWIFILGLVLVMEAEVRGQCTEDHECGRGALCVSGECVTPCTKNADCPDEEVCDQQRCQHQSEVQSRQHTQTPTAPLLIITDPPNADVIIDGKKSGHTPRKVYLKPGPYLVKVYIPGYKLEQHAVNVTQSGASLNLKLKPLSVKPIPVRVDSLPPLCQHG